MTDKQIGDGGPAFPVTEWGRTNAGEVVQHTVGGMAMRDYFAAQAMQGLLASDEYSAQNIETISRFAYSQADSMLRARAE